MRRKSGRKREKRKSDGKDGIQSICIETNLNTHFEWHEKDLQHNRIEE